MQCHFPWCTVPRAYLFGFCSKNQPPFIKEFSDILTDNRFNKKLRQLLPPTPYLNSLFPISLWYRRSQNRRIQDEKLLGVWISNELKWSKHLEQLESRFRTYADLGPTQEPFGLVAKKSSIFSQISMAPSNEHPLKK